MPGARLHTRIVVLFSLIAALPAHFARRRARRPRFSRSLDGWFSSRTRAIVDNSFDVAHAYLDEHGQVIRTDIVNMARTSTHAADARRTIRMHFSNLVIAQAGLRDLPSAYVIDCRGRADRAGARGPEAPLPRAAARAAIAQAEAGQVALLMPSDNYRVAAVAKLRQLSGLLSLRGARRQPEGRRASPPYRAERRRIRAGCGRREGGLKFAHGLMYFMISMTALLAAIWVGMWFAGRFVAPIRRLIAGGASRCRAATSRSSCPRSAARAICAACRIPSTP